MTNDKIRKRFMEKVQVGVGDECWRWLASLDAYGYGQFGVNNTMAKAHRVSYEMHIGSIPSGLLVCHACDVRNCVNPRHLFLGSHQDNMRDMSAKKRARTPSRRGSANGRAKLSEQSVRGIRVLVAKFGISRSAIARSLGVSVACISDAHSGKKFWSHV